MTPDLLHPTPAFRVVMWEQFRAVGKACRKEGIVVLAIALIMLTLALSAVNVQISSGTTDGTGKLITESFTKVPISLAALKMSATLSFFMGFLIPFSLWQDSNSSRQSYYLSMPLAHVPHTLIKMLAGWMWLIIMVGGYLMTMALIVYVRDANAMHGLAPETQRIFEFKQYDWVIPFTSASVLYVLSSALVIGSKRPWRWIGGVILAHGLLTYAINRPFLIVARYTWIAEAWRSIVTGKYGVATAVGINCECDQPHGFLATLLWVTLGVIAVCIITYRQSRT